MDTPTASPTSAPTPSGIRDELTDMVRLDLLGPAGGPEEELHETEDRVRERYLTGMLAPARQAIQLELMDATANGGSDSAEDGIPDTQAPTKESFIPSSIGLSFVVEPAAKAIRVATDWGRYVKIVSASQVTKDGNPARVWKRVPRKSEDLILPLVNGPVEPVSPCADDRLVQVQGRIRKADYGWVVTLFMINVTPPESRTQDVTWVFQPKLKVMDAREPGAPIFIHRRPSDGHMDDEQKALAMLYRHRLEFAVGHGVSIHATLPHPGADRALSVETEFLPMTDLNPVEPPGPDDNPDLAGVPLDMKTLAAMPRAELVKALGSIPEAYQRWIQRQEARAGEPDLKRHQEAAREASAQWRHTCQRIEEGIALVGTAPQAERAFRFANEVMAVQRLRSTFTRLVRKGERNPEDDDADLDIPKNRSWRLFQLAFILLNLPSLTRLDHPDRSHPTDAKADLLWFPTGGGKTEAYLGLTAYTLALRRLQGEIEGRAGDHGVAVLMRYTLRLLTLQQFQRAAALMCACESLRRQRTAEWGTTPFRLGLWVGAKATPNSLHMADQVLREANTGGRPSAQSTPHQLMSCPWCGTPIHSRNVVVYDGNGEIGRCVTYCGDKMGNCLFSEAQAPREGLPVMVVDEDIYRRPPSLLIATVDKFAQMPWNGQTQMLFGRVNGTCPRHGFLSPSVEDTGTHPKSGMQPRTARVSHGPLRPPDLIIQDELHLISGPLGSMVGLYECAVDELCSWTVNGKKVRPKVIASTATIRRAEEQVRQIFMRKVSIFPPQGLEIGDNFFAVQRKTGSDLPGRRYLGICAVGKRYPAAMIRVFTAFMASAQVLYERHGRAADPWMTLTGYFNSIRELAGTRRLTDDDIKSRLRDMDRRGLSKRFIRSIEELTSRKASSDIPKILERLETPFDPADEALRVEQRRNGEKVKPNPFDVVLATNMISVGVDIDRLGLMVVAGQPKTTSEYIQASSRVGRSKPAPGLVCTVFNWARPRDMSHYESFEHYHDTFYKHVEALSVTPFAPRALDRGLAGVMVGLRRLMGDDLNANVEAGRLQDQDPKLLEVIDLLVERAAQASGDKKISTLLGDGAERRRERWLNMVHQQQARAYSLGYQPTTQTAVGLLTRPGPGKPDLFTCLNSLRDVEATADLIITTNHSGLSLTADTTEAV